MQAKDKKRILPCSVYLEGEYGAEGVFAGVPVKLGQKGVVKILEIPLLPEEQDAFNRSAADVKTNVQRMYELIQQG